MYVNHVRPQYALNKHSFYLLGMLSPEGRCKTLDASADGYVRAEACGTFFLSTANLRDSKDHIGHASPPFLAILSGSAVNQDGRSSSLTAPNGPAQQQVIRQALQGIGSAISGETRGQYSASMSPSEVTSLSLHGTGTPLGDPIELGAAAAVLRAGGDGDGSRAGRTPITLMSSKSWFGHAEPASGEIIRVL